MKIKVKRIKKKTSPKIYNIVVYKQEENCYYFHIDFEDYFRPPDVDQGSNLHSDGSLDLIFWETVDPNPDQGRIDVHFIPENKEEKKVLSGYLCEISRKKQYSFLMYEFPKTKKKILGAWQSESFKKRAKNFS